jgi:uncharacterized protein YprB with RNaseH-like and TPR domain
MREIEAYLDIETTGLSFSDGMVTVIGIYRCDRMDSRVVQLVGREITAETILEALKGVGIIYTYNGSRFDLPYIRACLGIDLDQLFPHCDLMYNCWRNNLYGGLKAVEKQLGIKRKLKDVDGFEAVKLWWKYVDSFDIEALNRLLEYNKEDVVNLRALKLKLLDNE